MVRIILFCLLLLAWGGNAAMAAGPGKFQKKVIGGAAVGGATGSAFGSPLGPAGSAGGWAGGAAIGATVVVTDNHARKKWSGKGLSNWKNPKRW